MRQITGWYLVSGIIVNEKQKQLLNGLNKQYKKTPHHAYTHYFKNHCFFSTFSASYILAHLHKLLI